MTRRYKERDLARHNNEEQITLFFDTYLAHWTTSQLKYLRKMINTELAIHEKQFVNELEHENKLS